MKRIIQLVLIIALLSAVNIAFTEGIKPEITSVTWSDEHDGVLITFQKNGIEGDYIIGCHMGAPNDLWNGASGNSIHDSEETVVYCWDSGNLIPGETSSFWISVNSSDNNVIDSDEVGITIPLANVISPIKILEYSVPDISAQKLRAMQEQLQESYFQYQDELDKYLSIRDGAYEQAVFASFRTTDIVKVLIVAPDGAKACFWAGNMPFEEQTEGYYDFARNLADLFVFSFPVEVGSYEVRVFDWDRKCLIDSYSFNVCE